MVLIKIVLFVHILLQSLYLTAICSLLLLSFARFDLDLVHYIAELVLDRLVQRSNALFLL